MPWSDWRDDEGNTYTLPATLQLVSWDHLTGQRSTEVGGASSVTDAGWSSRNTSTLTGVTSSSETGKAYTIDPAYRTSFYWPRSMDGLVEGVDYDADPDTGDYYQYEPGGEVTHAGWTSPGDGDAAWDNRVNVTAVAPDGDVLVEVFGSDLLGAWPAYGSGTRLGLLRSTGTTGSFHVGAGVILPATTSVAVMVRDGLQHPSPPIPGSTETIWARRVTESALDGFTAATPFGTMPRYRYWIPERAKPLRQRQRDDGLGLSTARWRKGRSRQVSNRWRGYL